MIEFNFANRACLTALAACILTSCGGGGSGSNQNTGPTNTAPQFTSATSVSVAENTSAVVYTASANDANGDTVTFSLTDGDDASQFSIDQSGNLSFVETPDFESPSDSDRDNNYRVVLSASDGTLVTNLTLTVEVANDKEGIQLVRIAEGFENPVHVEFLLTLGPAGFEQAGRIAVAEESGEIFEVDGSTGERTLLADVFEGRPRGEVLDLHYFTRRNNLGSGLYAVAREPDGRVFMQRFGRGPIDEVELLPSGSPDEKVVIFEGPPENGPSGSLFAAIGDRLGTNAQNMNSPLGKFFFLEPLDPFAGASLRPFTFTPEIIGLGIRSPGGGGAINGQILLSDQGESIEHEMTFFPQDARPLNFGWPDREGTQARTENAPPSVNGPTIIYGVGSGLDEGTGIIFGENYQGSIPDLQNRYIFGDTSGLIWSVRFSQLTNGFQVRPMEMERRTEDFAPDVGELDSPIAFATDDQDRLFILDADGDLFRLDGS